MSEQSTPTGPPDGQSSVDLRAELARQQQEILRLRDLLVSKDAELGAAKGHLAELDERSQRVAAVAARIESRIPGFGRLVATVLRLLPTQQR